MTQWVPVSMWPESFGVYLVTYHWLDAEQGRDEKYVREALFMDGRWELESKTRKVLAWAELPKPYGE